MDNGSKGRARRREQRPQEQIRQMEGRDADPSKDALVGVPPWWQQERHRSSQRENGVAGREQVEGMTTSEGCAGGDERAERSTPRCCVRQPLAGRVLEATRDGPTQQCVQAPRLIRGEEFTCLILPRGLLQYWSSKLLSSLCRAWSGRERFI